MTDPGVQGMQPLFCYRCGHLWAPKSDAEPKRCPRCHSCRWNVPERRLRMCKFCGKEYRLDSVDDPCPECGRRQTEGLVPAALHCNQCDYDWIRRTSSNPVRCPVCNSVDWNMPKAERLMCQQCGHVWRKQSRNPVKCPRCQSRLWNQPLRAVRCLRCGHVWKMRAARSYDSRSVCPKCKTKKWNEPLLVSRTRENGRTVYSTTRLGSASKVLMHCGICGSKWYASDGSQSICTKCGTKVGFHDWVRSTSMVLWTEGRSELTYVTENGYGCVYLWSDDTPVTCRYMHEILREIDMTISEVVDAVNRGDMRETWEEIANDMYRTRDDYACNIDYFVKRLFISRDDANILALHFSGMSPEAIARKLDRDESEINASFDRIMSAYSDSGIVVDDTIFTEDPFRYYRVPAHVGIPRDPLSMDMPCSNEHGTIFKSIHRIVLANVRICDLIQGTQSIPQSLPFVLKWISDRHNRGHKDNVQLQGCQGW